VRIYLDLCLGNLIVLIIELIIDNNKYALSLKDY